MRDLIAIIERMFTSRPLQTNRFKKYVSGDALPDNCLIYCSEDLTCTITDYDGNIEALVPFTGKQPIPFKFKKITNISTGSIYLCY